MGEAPAVDVAATLAKRGERRYRAARSGVAPETWAGEKKGGPLRGRLLVCGAGAQAIVSSTSMLPRVAFEYGHTW
jgi:hypothetical protein